MICKICNKYNCENHSIDDQKEYEILISLKNIRKAEKGGEQ